MYLLFAFRFMQLIICFYLIFNIIFFNINNFQLPISTLYLIPIRSFLLISHSRTYSDDTKKIWSVQYYMFNRSLTSFLESLIIVIENAKTRNTRKNFHEASYCYEKINLIKC